MRTHLPITALLIAAAMLPTGQLLADTTPTDATSTSAVPTANTGSLQAVAAKHLDQLQMNAKGLPDTPLVVDVVVNVHYSKRRHDLAPDYRETDFQLTPQDLALLQNTTAKSFAKGLLAPRGWQLATDPAKANARLTLDFDDFWLAAPLRESLSVRKTFTEESARFTLKGRLDDVRPDATATLLTFSDKRRLRQITQAPGRIERFTSVTFWRDMGLDLTRAAGLLQHELVTDKLAAGKNGQPPIKSAQ